MSYCQYTDFVPVRRCIYTSDINLGVYIYLSAVYIIQAAIFGHHVVHQSMTYLSVQQIIFKISTCNEIQYTKYRVPHLSPVLSAAISFAVIHQIKYLQKHFDARFYRIGCSQQLDRLLHCPASNHVYAHKSIACDRS